MLYIEFDYDGRQENEGGASMHWHTGTEIHPNFINRIPRVMSVQADGDETAWIRHEFGGTIPWSRGAVQYWYGDIAKTIAARIIHGNQ